VQCEESCISTKQYATGTLHRSSSTRSPTKTPVAATQRCNAKIYTQERQHHHIVQPTSTALPPRSLDSLLKPHDPQTLSALETAAHELSSRNERIVPVTEDGLHVARHALKDDGCDGHEGAILFRDSEDAVLLCEHERCGERGGLAASQCANDATLC
jgi:hypothetical protein